MVKNAAFQSQTFPMFSSFGAKQRSHVFYVLLTFALYYLVCVFYPYTGDDWAWGSSIGINRLENFFADYNGRYMGNIIVLLLTRIVFLRNLFMAATFAYLCYLCHKFSHTAYKTTYILAVVLLLSVPRLIFRQALVWTSGYVNYAIPTALILTYILFVRKIFLCEKPLYHKFSFITTAALGVVSSLFVENITIYNVLISLYIFAFTLMKFKKIFFVHISYFAGSVIGAIIMFTNGAYGIIARGEGGYRSIAGFDQMLRRARANYMSTIFRTLVYNNHILNIFMTIMLIAIAVMAIRNNHAKWHKITLYLVTTINLSYVVYTSMRLISPTWQVFLRLTDKFEALFTAFYFASIIIIILLGIKNSMTKNKILFLYSSIVILTSPLFLVTPIGERCFFPSYVLFIIIVCELYVYLADSYHWTYHHEDVIKKVTLVILAIMYLQIASIYIYIGVKDDERNRYALEQVQNGAQEVTLFILPYDEFLWHSTPDSGTTWERRYKLFHGIDTDISLKIITYDEYYATIKTR